MQKKTLKKYNQDKIEYNYCNCYMKKAMTLTMTAEHTRLSCNYKINYDFFDIFKNPR